MNADEILLALSQTEGLYIELGDWAIVSAQEDTGEIVFLAGRYTGLKPNTRECFSLLPAAIEFALKDGKE